MDLEQMPDGRWVYGIPLPWFLVFGVECGDCGRKFLGRRRRAERRYRQHFGKEHASPFAQGMNMTPKESR